MTLRTSSAKKVIYVLKNRYFLQFLKKNYDIEKQILMTPFERWMISLLYSLKISLFYMHLIKKRKETVLEHIESKFWQKKNKFIAGN